MIDPKYALILNPNNIVIWTDSDPNLIRFATKADLNLTAMTLFDFRFNVIKNDVGPGKFVRLVKQPITFASIEPTAELRSLQTKVINIINGYEFLQVMLDEIQNYYGDSILLNSKDLSLYRANPEPYIAAYVEAGLGSTAIAQKHLDFDYVTLIKCIERTQYVKFKYQQLLLTTVYDEQSLYRWKDLVFVEAQRGGIT